MPDLLASAPRPPAVAKPKGDVKRKAAPKCGVVKNAGKAKGVGKGKAPAGFAVAPVLPVVCGMASGPPVLPPPLGPACLLPPHFPGPRAPGAAPAPAVVPPIAMGLAPGLALPAFHRGLHPAGFSTRAWRNLRNTHGIGCRSTCCGACSGSHVKSQQRCVTVVSRARWLQRVAHVCSQTR